MAVKRSIRKKLFNEDTLFSIFIYTVLCLITATVMLPILYIYGGSFAAHSEFLTRRFFLIPREWTFDAFTYLFSNERFLNSLWNSIVITGVGTFINISLTTLMAYSLSKRWLPGRAYLNFMVLFTILFAGGMIPTYLIVNSLGLINSYWAIWLTSAISPFYLIVMRGLFSNIPKELEEAGRIDGCGEFRLFWNVALPLAKPALATFTIFYLVGHWNSYFEAVLYLHDHSKMPLQVLLRQMIIQNEETLETVDEIAFSPAVPMAAIVITITPLIVIFPFFQKYFNKGFLLGSVKG
ncbi:carbohydrate ABC transporter permease [Salipaludibacillus sp. LMS25]|jgi:putative aldouronate transport system permease protein|uniref:carbohydrate ABC transporter permease n=1 Tax=Salipaludibacillus sp. LMS25 TaxID=2924031 RepID=UPI0020D1EC58|nr:carbohydrate ABC transporter permease [Salipaludibacillus sp. LMS25]UTR16536.1 carbohydrate ABC transporter permease [Salipaludibacillus sp. LMS25]